MILSASRQRCTMIGILMAGALALGLAACEQKPSSENLFRNIGDAGPPMEQPANPVGPDSGLAPGAASDAALAAKVKAALTAEPGLKSLKVDVNAADGVVTLFGTADSPKNSHQAAIVALNVEGVRSVKNELVILRGS